MLPGTSTAPAIMTTRPVLRRASASRRSASARFVNGPSAMSVNRSPWARARATSVSAADGEAGGLATGGQSGASPRPSLPCWSGGTTTNGLRSGAAAPRAIWGRRAGRRTATRRAAFRAVSASGALPATTVSARTSSSGEPQASSNARASSMPGSVSRTVGITLILSAFRPQPCHLASDRQFPDVVGVVIGDDQTTPKEGVLAATVGHRREEVAGRIPDELDDGAPILVKLRERPSPLGQGRSRALSRPVALWKRRLLI